MARLIATMLCSLDGYSADADGNFDWSAPDEELHGFINDHYAGVRTFLYGRRMYQTMQVWETFTGPEQPPVMRDYAQQWIAAEKIVYSSTLPDVTTTNTRLERAFDPDAVRELVGASAHDLSVSGPTLARSAFTAGLVDEVGVFITPVIVGGGTRFLPDDIRLDLELVDEQRFAGGVVFVNYRVKR